MRRIFAFSIACLLIAAPAFALTAGDVLDKMTQKERDGYLAGAIEMAMTIASGDGQGERAACIGDFYFRTERGPRLIIAAFDRYRDRPAAAVINALLARECPAR